MTEAVIAVIALALIAVYFLPAIIAGGRNTRNQGGIVALNVLLGWTLVGWLLAAIWAITEKAEA
jgi:hypothetical protein